MPNIHPVIHVKLTPQAGGHLVRSVGLSTLTERAVVVNKTYINLTQPSSARQSQRKIGRQLPKLQIITANTAYCKPYD